MDYHVDGAGSSNGGQDIDLEAQKIEMIRQTELTGALQQLMAITAESHQQLRATSEYLIYKFLYGFEMCHKIHMQKYNFLSSTILGLSIVLLCGFWDRDNKNLTELELVNDIQFCWIWNMMAPSFSTAGESRLFGVVASPGCIEWRIAPKPDSGMVLDGLNFGGNGCVRMSRMKVAHASYLASSTFSHSARIE